MVFGEVDPVLARLFSAATVGGALALVNERLHLLTDGSVTVEFKRTWSDGTRRIGLHPKALLFRMAALVPAPSDMPAKPVLGQSGRAEKKPKAGLRKYIPWHELLRRTFGEEVRCPHCGGPL